MLAGEHHAYEFLGLGEPARLDDDDVDPGGGLSEPVQILIKFTDIDRTAQTPVAERDGGVAERSGHGHRVDLDRAEVVDDGSDATATAAVQEMVEQCGLAGTQEAA